MSLVFQSLGVVYGDIGILLLYVYVSIFIEGIYEKDDIIGVFLFIIYIFIFVVFFKYVFIVFQVNDNGEGIFFFFFRWLIFNINYCCFNFFFFID